MTNPLTLPASIPLRGTSGTTRQSIAASTEAGSNGESFRRMSQDWAAVSRVKPQPWPAKSPLHQGTPAELPPVAAKPPLELGLDELLVEPPLVEFTGAASYATLPEQPNAAASKTLRKQLVMVSVRILSQLSNAGKCVVTRRQSQRSAPASIDDLSRADWTCSILGALPDSAANGSCVAICFASNSGPRPKSLRATNLPATRQVLCISHSARQAYSVGTRLPVNPAAKTQ